MSRKVNVWEICKVIEAYKNLKNLHEWAFVVKFLNETVHKNNSISGVKIIKLIEQVLETVKSSFLDVCPHGQSFNEVENDIELKHFKLIDLSEEFIETVPLTVFKKSWNQSDLNALMYYIFADLPAQSGIFARNKIQKKTEILQQSQQNQAGPSTVKDVRSNPRKRLWEDDELEKLCGSDDARVSIPQTITLESDSFAQSIQASNGVGEFTIQVKVFKTSDIMKHQKLDWWKYMSTNMQFTASEDEPAYDMITDLTLFLVNKFKNDENFKTERRKKIRN